MYQKTGEGMIRYVDAEWANDHVDRKLMGNAFTLGGAVVSWESRKKRIALLSTEAEYI
jgi:hypothetical protein